MKRMKTIFTVSVLVLGLAISGAVIASPKRDGHFRKGGAHHEGGRDGLMSLTRAVQKNLMVQALSDVTQQPVEKITDELKEKRFRAVMEEYKVDRRALNAALATKTEAMLTQLASNGTITPEQKDRIVLKMKAREERHVLMAKLIQKGVADGTITALQAEMLQKR